MIINISRTSLREELEHFQPLAAVEGRRYFQWMSERGQEKGYGLLGRKSLAHLLGATLASGPFTTETYGMLKSDTYTTLPEFLVAYLRVAESAETRAVN